MGQRKFPSVRYSADRPHAPCVLDRAARAVSHSQFDHRPERYAVAVEGVVAFVAIEAAYATPAAQSVLVDSTVLVGSSIGASAEFELAAAAVRVHRTP
mmetsp:Transcript_18533/g.37681  ORF Transcript_18533/g.37681 Transcript_18533/m.37681 type:complete len:98 (+) Transcript_18533:796-1089(+)